MKTPTTQRLRKSIAMLLVAFIGFATTGAAGCGDCGDAEHKKDSAIYILPQYETFAVKWIAGANQVDELFGTQLIIPTKNVEAPGVKWYPGAYTELSTLLISPTYECEALAVKWYPGAYTGDQMATLLISPTVTDEELLGTLLIVPREDNEIVASQDYAVLASDQWMATGESMSPYAYQWVKDILYDRNAIELQDGSVWVFDATDGDIIDSWKVGDALVLTSKSSWLGRSNYGYMFTSRTLNNSASVNLHYGPVKYGKDTFWISALDRDRGQLHIINGKGERSLWEVSPSDKQIFDEWHAYDRVIVGKNNRWVYLWSNYDHIL